MLPAKKARADLSEGGFPAHSLSGSITECIYVTGRVVSFPIWKPLATLELQRDLIQPFIGCLVIREACNCIHHTMLILHKI